MTTPRSPFYVIEDFISPLTCEDVILDCDFNVPDTDHEGNYVLTTKTCERAETALYQRLHAEDQIIHNVCGYYGVKYKGTSRMTFEWYAEGARGIARSENSDFVSGKWMRTRARDLTGILFLSDYQDQPPFDDEYEVYGGKLEFPQHRFGFNPQRGTLVFFPSDPHFINVTSPIIVGDCYQVRFHVTASAPFIYQPAQFPGTFVDWFRSKL